MSGMCSVSTHPLLSRNYVMKFTYITDKGGSIVVEEGLEIPFGEWLFFVEGDRLDVSVGADVIEHTLEVFFLFGVERAVGEVLGIEFQSLGTVYFHDGADESGYTVSADEATTSDVALVFFLGAQFFPADLLEGEDVCLRKLLQGTYLLQNREVPVFSDIVAVSYTHLTLPTKA